MVLDKRSSWDTLQSAAKGIYSILTSPKSRDTFVNTIDKGIINPNMLGQHFSYGWLMTLALHHDLNSSGSYFQKNGFDEEEFVEGSHVAVEHFQECMYRLDKKIVGNIEDIIKELRKEEELDQLKQPQKKGIIDNYDSVDPQMNKEEVLKRTLLMVPTILIKLKNYENKNEEEEYEMMKMVSGQCFEDIESESRESALQCYINDNSKLDYKLESGKVLEVSDEN